MAIHPFNADVAALVPGGDNRPYRVFRNVGATATAATPPTGLAAELNDPAGLGRVYAIRSITVKTLKTPTLATTITIQAVPAGGGAAVTVFQRANILVANVPVVGNTLEVLGVNNARLPDDIPLPVILMATATGGGTFEIIVDGLLK